MIQQLEKFLEDQYDHVQKFDKTQMSHAQISRVKEHALNRRACVDRNLHNGETTNMIIKVKMTQGENLYLAGDEE